MSRWWEQVGTSGASSGGTGPRKRSVYEDRYRHEPRWRPVASEHPLTGEMEWRPDWVEQLSGWRPLEKFLEGRR